MVNSQLSACIVREKPSMSEGEARSLLIDIDVIIFR